MKFFQKGFTIAELLLVIAIIGIVSAMGASITKKTTEKAYNLFYYTGFTNLYNAYADTKINSGKTESNRVGGGTCNINISTPICHINNLLGTTAYNGNGGFTIIARNGITYEFEVNNDISPILMGIPQPKTRNNPNGRVFVMIMPTQSDGSTGIERGEYLIMVDTNKFSGASGIIPGRPYLHLGSRRDLLPTYIDDGIKGRMRTDLTSGQTAYNHIDEYYSYDQAICSALKKRNPRNFSGSIILKCEDVSNVPAFTSTAIKFADPRRAK